MEKIKKNKKAEDIKDFVNITVNLAGTTIEEITNNLFLNNEFEYWSKDEVSMIYEVIKSFDGYSADRMMIALLGNCDEEKINCDIIITQLYFLIKIIRPELFEDYEAKNV